MRKAKRLAVKSPVRASRLPGMTSRNAVQRHREELGLSKADLAKLADVSYSTIGRLETECHARAATYHRILHGLNKARISAGLTELKLDDIFPNAMRKPAMPSATLSRSRNSRSAQIH
jgi:DNA-binding XRE family transcriptional regulator